jgi:enoyl-CoA hydratase/carnithine racemase
MSERRELPVLLDRRDDGVAVVTLNRPEARNAFGGGMGEALGEAYTACDEDDGVRAVVLTGAGRAFCAGADLAPRSETFRSQRGSSTFSASPVDPAPWQIRKPVIAAINGHAVGLGMTLALQCDIRLVADDAKCGVVHVRRGVIPDAHAHWIVPRVVGLSRAAEILLTGRLFTGPEVVAMGLASRSLPAEEVLPAALELAADIAANTAPLSVAISKRLLWQSSTLTRQQMEHLETELHHVVMGRPDAAEGVLAFLEKRQPAWTLSPTEDWPAWPEPGDPGADDGR